VASLGSRTSPTADDDVVITRSNPSMVSVQDPVGTVMSMASRSPSVLWTWTSCAGTTTSTRSRGVSDDMVMVVT